MQEKFEKMFINFQIMAFEDVPGIFLNYDENIWERQSRFYQTVINFQI